MRTFFVISFLLLATLAYAQEVPVTTEQQLENLNEENIDDDALLQQLAFYQKHPLNLNAAAPEDLYPLRLLTEWQIQSFIRYRAVFGKLLSIYELQAVPGFDLLTIRRLLPFVSVDDAQTVADAFSTRLRGGSYTTIFRISRIAEKSKGYDPTLKTHYLGDPNRLLFRYTYQYKNLMYYGLTAKKDAGEQFFNGAQKSGFDFYSFHFFARNMGKIKALALGDFTVNLGQGLTQWQTLAFGKSAEVVGIKRQAPVLLPYRSAGEFYFNRGAAITLQSGRWQLTSFLSYKKFSGNLVSDTTDRFTSFGTSGYYRTPAEIADRYKLADFSTGGNLAFLTGRLKIGANAVLHRFSLPLQKSNEPYNRFQFSGRELFLTSLDYGFTHKNAHFFGEFATDNHFHHALVQGMLLSVDPKIDFSVLYRNIQKEYQAPFGNAFTESNLPSNEAGMYTGIQVRPIARWQLSAYADVYRFPFIKYRVSSPTKGADYLVQVLFTPNKRTETYLRYRTETKPSNDTGGVIHSPENVLKQSLRLHYANQVNRFLSVKCRTEMVWVRKSSSLETGLLTYAEAAFQPLSKLKGSLRLAYFKTDGYDSRIYAYESDVPFSFSIPAMFDAGWRYYLNLAFDANKSLSVWLRVAQSRYVGKEAIGSGLDEIQGNHKTEIKLQVQCSF